jgi:hypothetical protein
MRALVFFFTSCPVCKFVYYKRSTRRTRLIVISFFNAVICFRVFFHFCVQFIIHIKWVPCHHGMVHPQVGDGGYDLQIWWAGANIFNKQSLTANRGGPPAWGLGGGANNSPTVKPLIFYISLRALDQGRFLARPRHQTMDMRFGTWNVRSLYRISSL